MGLVKGFTDIIAPVNLINNGNFRKGNDQFYSLAPATANDTIGEAWIISAFTVAGLQARTHTTNGTLQLKGSGNRGQTITVRNTSLPGKQPFSPKTLAVNVAMTNLSIPTNVDVICASSVTARTYRKTAVLNARRLSDRAIDIATPNSTSEGYVLITLMADGEFDVTLSKAVYMDGEYVNPPVNVEPISDYQAKSNAANNIYFTGPGPQELIGGDFATTGFFGEMPSSHFIHGWELLAQLWQISGVNSKQDLIDAWDADGDGSVIFAGDSYTSFNDNLECPWLKFFSKGKILFVPLRPLVNNLSWNHIDTALRKNGGLGAVGGREIEIDLNRWNPNYRAGSNVKYKCRLLTGANSNPSYGNFDDRGKAGVELGAGSEWNNLIYRIHTQKPLDTESESGGKQFGENWANYTTNQFGNSSNDYGRATWCQETYGWSSGRRVFRGDYGVVRYFNHYNASHVHEALGFRPALELSVL